MAYKIEYSPQFNHKYTRQKKILKPWKGILACCMIVFAAVMLLNHNCRDFLKEILIPGKAEITVAAAETMVQNLKDGSSLKDAVSVFCIEVLKQANAH